jgi:hypothetical protein
MGHGAFLKMKKVKNLHANSGIMHAQMPHLSIFVGNGAFFENQKVKIKK